MLILEGVEFIRENNKYGIETLQKVIEYTVQTVGEVRADLADGRISIPEGVGLFDNVRDGGKLIIGWRNALNELKDLDSSERDDLTARLLTSGLLSPKTAQEQIDWCIKSLENLVKTAEHFAKFPTIFPKK